LNRWQKYFSQLLHIQRVGDVREINIHAAEPLEPDPSPFEVETVSAELKNITRQVVIKFWQK
jgi:hypothetical protein